MAITCSCSCSQMVARQGGGSIRKPLNKVFFMLHNSQPLPTSKTPRVQIRFSIDNKVFEDQARGIVCYKDDNGEIICEGHDEGPRFQKQTSIQTCNSKELQIIDILERSWFQIADEDEIHQAEKGVTDFDWDGFKRYYC